MKDTNTTRVKLAAANMLYETRSLSEIGELQTLSEAETIFHHDPDALTKDVSLRSLVHWAICLFSDNSKDLQTILHDVKDDNRGMQLKLAILAINHLPWESICSIVEEQSPHLDAVPKIVIAQFCTRSIRRLLQTTAHMDMETEAHEEGDESGQEEMALRVTTAIETLLMELRKIPAAATEIAASHYQLALTQRQQGVLAIALNSVKEAKIACPKDERHSELLLAIDVLMQNIIEDMQQGEMKETDD